MRRLAAYMCILCWLLTGCAFWMSGERLSVTPHEAHGVEKGKEVVAVTSFAQLRNVLQEHVELGEEEIIISASSFNETTLDYYVSTAVNHITDSTAVGAYAVNKITYEIGKNRGSQVVAFRVEYKYGKTELEKIKMVASVEQMTEELTNALNRCEQSVTVLVEHYQAFDFTKFVDEYASLHPDQVMETPYVSVATYPANGDERILEITLTYLTEREQLLEMQRQVQAMFTSAELYVKETQKEIDSYARLYSFLMERSEYTLQPSQTPAYSLLHSGVGDSRAFANVYAAMCKRAGLDCQVVSGLREGELWYWNAIRYRDHLYHIDLLCCNENNVFALVSGKDMDGYEWDTSAFPMN